MKQTRHAGRNRLYLPPPLLRPILATHLQEHRDGAAGHHRENARFRVARATRRPTPAIAATQQRSPLAAPFLFLPAEVIVPHAVPAGGKVVPRWAAAPPASRQVRGSSSIVVVAVPATCTAATAAGSGTGNIAAVSFAVVGITFVETVEGASGARGGGT